MNAKKKGNAGENKFANFLQSQGIKAYKNSSSGGNENKSDIHNSLGLNLEVKTVKKINLLKAFKQSERDASLAHTEPVLAIHFDSMPENTWLIVMHSNDWIEQLKLAQEGENKGKTPLILNETPENKQTTRELTYALSTLKNSISRVIKLLE